MAGEIDVKGESSQTFEGIRKSSQEEKTREPESGNPEP